MKASLAMFVCLILASSCSRKYSTELVKDVMQLEGVSKQSSADRKDCNCQDHENYLPREELSVLQDIKNLRTAFVFPNNRQKTHNWEGTEAVQYAKHLVIYGNRKLSKNRPMFLPEGNDTPVYPIPWRYELSEAIDTGSGLAVYEAVDDTLAHFVSSGKGKNNYSSTIIKKYARGADHQLNVFAMVHHPDSLLSPSYNKSMVGIALGSSVKIADVKSHTIVDSYKIATLLNHEVGHVMGLRHSWTKNDGCDDTPSHPNCFQEGPGKCKVISNNMMDYNRVQAALSPCQIGKVTYNLHKEQSVVRKLLVKDWCAIDHSKTLIVKDSLHLDRAADLKGNILVSPGAVLMISCRVHMPAQSKIMVSAGGKLILNGCRLHNDCGEQWDGIELIHQGRRKAILEMYGNVRITDTAKNSESNTP